MEQTANADPVDGEFAPVECGLHVGKKEFVWSIHGAFAAGPRTCFGKGFRSQASRAGVARG